MRTVCGRLPAAGPPLPAYAGRWCTRRSRAGARARLRACPSPEAVGLRAAPLLPSLVEGIGESSLHRVPVACTQSVLLRALRFLGPLLPDSLWNWDSATVPRSRAARGSPLKRPHPHSRAPRCLPRPHGSLRPTGACLSAGCSCIWGDCLTCYHSLRHEGNLHTPPPHISWTAAPTFLPSPCPPVLPSLTGKDGCRPRPTRAHDCPSEVLHCPG